MNEKTQFFIDHIDEIIIYPGVEDILVELSSKNIKFALASNGSRATIEKMVDTYDFLSHCEGIIAHEDVTNGKPHPEMVLKALDLLNLAPEEVFMVGDSIYDIQAAQAAGTHTIAIPAEYESNNFEELNPTYLLNNFIELKEIISSF
jgi:HAD superfamily hydrolase (TIGR01509 family)